MDDQNAAPTLSTPDTHIFERRPNVRPKDIKPQLSDAQIRITYEIDRTLAEIRKCKYRRVALQFPDGMLTDAPRVFTALKSGLKTLEPNTDDPRDQSNYSDNQPISNGDLFEVKMFILGDTSYGACCVDEVAADHADANVVVHYGRSCLSPTSRIPAFYVFTKQALETDRLIRHFQSFYEDHEQKIILMADVTYQDHLPNLKADLEGQGYCNLFLAEIVHDPSSSLPNRTVPEVVKADPLKLKDYQLFHISDPPEALLLTLSSRVGDVQIYSASYTAGDSYNIVEPSATRALARRYALLTSVSTVSIFGILINTLSVKNYLHVVEHVKSQILAAGKKSYTFVVGKVNAAKIANFSEIGAWVVIGCWESSLIDSKDFWKPVITPFELNLALKSDDERVWTGEWSSDFQRVLNEAREAKEPEGKRDLDRRQETAEHAQATDGGDLDSEPESAPPDFDLRSGRYISQTRPMRAAGTDRELVTSSDDPSVNSLTRRPRGDVIAVGGTASPGAAFLQSKRTWKGLGSDFEIAYEEGGVLEEGHSGIARGYTHGGETNNPSRS